MYSKSFFYKHNVMKTLLKIKVFVAHINNGTEEKWPYLNIILQK